MEELKKALEDIIKKPQFDDTGKINESAGKNP